MKKMRKITKEEREILLNMQQTTPKVAISIKKTAKRRTWI